MILSSHDKYILPHDKIKAIIIVWQDVKVVADILPTHVLRHEFEAEGADTQV